jgi:hypothetical protein
MPNDRVFLILIPSSIFFVVAVITPILTALLTGMKKTTM